MRRATAPGTRAARKAGRNPPAARSPWALRRGTGLTDDAAFADLGDTLALARFPNLAIKMSCAPSNRSQPYPYRNIHGYLRQIFETFGPDRAFWRTDITACRARTGNA